MGERAAFAHFLKPISPLTYPRASKKDLRQPDLAQNVTDRFGPPRRNINVKSSIFALALVVQCSVESAGQIPFEEQPSAGVNVDY